MLTSITLLLFLPWNYNNNNINNEIVEGDLLLRGRLAKATHSRVFYVNSRLFVKIEMIEFIPSNHDSIFDLIQTLYVLSKQVTGDNLMKTK